jgi:hypothetical protein
MDIISANILLHHKQRIGIEVGKRIPSVWADEREDRLVCRSEGNENFEGAGTVVVRPRSKPVHLASHLRCLLPLSYVFIDNRCNLPEVLFLTAPVLESLRPNKRPGRSRTRPLFRLHIKYHSLDKPYFSAAQKGALHSHHWAPRYTHVHTTPTIRNDHGRRTPRSFVARRESFDPPARYSP